MMKLLVMIVTSLVECVSVLIPGCALKDYERKFHFFVFVHRLLFSQR